MVLSPIERDPITELQIFLRENCFVFSLNDELNTITQEQSLFVRDIETCLNDTNAQKNYKNTIINGIKMLCPKQDYFKKILLPTMLKKPGLNIAIEQESLMRLLLKINGIQDDLILLILDEIEKTVSEDVDNPSFLRLLLNQLKYLPSINKSEELTTKLLDIIEISNQPMQLEILDILPEILPDNRYNQAARQLITFLNSDDSPIAAIIDCLNALNLDDSVKAEIQDIILLRILPGRVYNFPVLMEFLLGNSKGSNSSLLLKIRDALDGVMSSAKNSTEKDSSKVLIYNKLKLYITTRKQFAQDCLDMINSIKTSNDHKPIDIFLLFLLYSSVRNKKRIIELIFRKKIKGGLFKHEYLEKLFQYYMPQQVFRERFYSIVEIGCNFITTSEEHTIKSFTETLFKLLFAHKYTEGIYRKEILDNLLLLVGGNDEKCIHQVLQTFLILIKEDVNKFKQHTLIMMRLLEKMDSLDLNGIEQVFEILCYLTCQDENDESMLSLKDEIHMIIRKQLSSSKKNIKFRGIIGAVIMAKHIAEIEESDSNSEDSELAESSSIDDLPQGKAQNAAKLINMANDRISGCYECMGLFYDQLALMLLFSNNLNKYFLSWLSKIMMKNFLNNFVLDKFSNVEVNDIRYTEQYSLNEETESESSLMVNIGLMTVKPEDCDKSSVQILASHFRSLRLIIHKKYNGDLSAINVLLGCPVILPQIDNVEDLDNEQLRQVTDCIFHCINWFRELISAYIFNKALRNKIRIRLQQLIQLEKQLTKLLSRIPDHLLPRSYFNSASQNKQVVTEIKKKPPTKRLKSQEEHNDTVASTSVLSGKEKKKSASTSVKFLQECNIQFREIDPDFYKLLKLPLNFDSETEGLNIYMLTFILKDLVKKLNIIILGKKNNLTPVNVIKPENLIQDLVKMLPYVNRHFIALIDKIKNIVTENDGCEDAQEMFTDDVHQYKICISYILECYSIILSWPDLQQAKNMEILKKILLGLKIDESNKNSINFLSSELIDQFIEYVEHCLLISQGVFLMKIIKSLNNSVTNDKKRKTIDDACRTLLSKRWYNEKGDLDTGKNFTQGINYLVNTYLESMKVTQLNDLIANVLNECENIKSKNDYLTILPSIDFKNFHIFYQGLCAALHSSIKSEIPSLTSIGHLEMWSKTTDSMSNLMFIARSMKIKAFLSIYLKKSIAILKIFIFNGMPIFEILFSSNIEEVVGIFKRLQSSTRFLHQLCCDTKVKKSIPLVPHIPHFRLMLEQLIYKVKALLVANNCSNAFFMGNLKNKDIDGNTQTTERTETDDGSSVNEEMECEEVQDDSDIEVEVNQDEEDGSGSDSDIF